MATGAGADAGNAPGPTVWHRGTSTAYVESPGRVVVLDLDRPSQAPYVFEGSAAEIWACVDGERTERSIAGEVARSHEVEMAVVADDVHEFLATLHTTGLVVSDPA